MCWIHEVSRWKRAAVCEFAIQYPTIGCRKPTWEMVDVGPLYAGGQYDLRRLYLCRHPVALEVFVDVAQRISFAVNSVELAAECGRDWRSGGSRISSVPAKTISCITNC